MDRYEFLKQFHDISKTEYDLLNSKLKTKAFKKGELITVPRQVQKELYFVKSGVQLSYFESENKTHVSCLTDNEMDYLTFDMLQELFEQSPAIERLFRKITEATLAGMIDRHVELHSMSIEERFKTFCNRSPHLLQIVPHKYLASYLAIDASNFSKLFNRVKF